MHHHTLSRIGLMLSDASERNPDFEEIQDVLKAIAIECGVVTGGGKLRCLNNEVDGIYLRQAREYVVESVVVEHQDSVLPRIAFLVIRHLCELARRAADAQVFARRHLEVSVGTGGNVDIPFKQCHSVGTSGISIDIECCPRGLDVDVTGTDYKRVFGVGVHLEVTFARKTYSALRQRRPDIRASCWR